MNGAQRLVKALEKQHIRTVFGYTGGAIVPVYDALTQSHIDVVINSNEQAAAFAASGMSRSSDTVGVAIVTSGPSITNTLTAVTDAYCDSIPLVIIAGQVPQHKLGTDAFQYVDVKSVFSPITKQTFLVDGPNIEHIVQEAFAIATSGRPGPVVIDYPVNLQREIAHECQQHQRSSTRHTALTEHDCESFFAHLLQSKKPLLYIGGGLNNPKGSQAMGAFEQTLQIPSVNTLMGKGILEPNNPHAMGMLGMFGVPAANKIVQENDFFFAAGVRWDDRVAEKVGSFGNHAKIAYIDINAQKVDQIRSERSPVFTHTGCAADAIMQLSAYAKKNNIRLDIDEWRQTAQAIKKKWTLNYDRNSQRIQQAAVMERLARIEGDRIVTTGVGNHQMFAAQYLPIKSPRSFLTSASFGVMGFALPAAIGAWYANPSREIVAIDGDGSFGMNLGELKTIVQYNIPIKMLVLNNHGDGMVRNLQHLTYQRTIGTDRQVDISAANIAQSMGIYAKRIASTKDIAKGLDELLSQKGPALLEVMCDPAETVYPRIPAGKNYADMDLGPVMGKNG